MYVCMVMYANEVETKEKEKLAEIKNQLQHIHLLFYMLCSSFKHLNTVNTHQ